MSTAPASIQPGSYCNHVAVHRALDAADLLREQKIGGSGLSVLIGIARHCNQEDECWPSYKCIAEEMLMSKSTVGRALAELIDVGAVQVSKGDARASNSYIFQPECIHPREIRDRTTEVDSQSATMTLGSPRYSESHHGTQSATMTTQSPMVTHEVVKEVVKEKVNEGVKPDSKPAGKVGLVTFKGPPVKGKAKEESLRTPDAKTSTPPVSLRFDQEVKATTTPAHPEMPTPVDPTPESRLANLYFTSLGEPRKHKEAVKDKWPVTFRTLLEAYTETDLHGALTWAFNSSFWAGKDFLLDHHACDPVDYFATKAATIVGQWEDFRKSANRKVPVSSGGPRNQPPVLDQDAKDMIRGIFRPDEF